MTAPFLARLLGTRKGRSGFPNISDTDSKASVAISMHMLEQLELVREADSEGQSAGALLEREVADHLKAELPKLDASRNWLVTQGTRELADFRQYEHIAELRRLIDEDHTGTLSITIGGRYDYQIKPDVTVGLTVPGGDVWLHASISCKLTLRSDRAQNVRQEAATIIRHRRGRQPHIVAVTAEPLPTRLASIARGTGDIDTLYHVALPELIAAVDTTGTSEQQTALEELVSQDRIFDFDRLAPTLLI